MASRISFQVEGSDADDSVAVVSHHHDDVIGVDSTHGMPPTVGRDVVISQRILSRWAAVMSRFLANGIRKVCGGRTLNRWGAGGENDAWRSVGTCLRGDRYRLALKVRHDPGLPHPNQRGSRANTNAGIVLRQMRSHRGDYVRRPREVAPAKIIASLRILSAADTLG